MATLILSAATPAGAGFWTSFGFAAVGGLIDSAVASTLQKDEPAEGLKLDDLIVGQSQDGSQAPWMRGLHRVEGTVIYADPPVGQSEGGTNKAGPDVGGTAYRMNVVYGFARDCGLGAVVERVRANGELIYSNAPNIELESSEISAEADSSVSGGVGSTVTTELLTLRSPIGGPDLTAFELGFHLSVEGFTNDANNFEANDPNSVEAIQSSGDPDGGTFLRLRRKGPDPFVDEAAGNFIRIFQELPATNPAIIESASIALGTDEQAPDSFIESLVGEGELSGYPGTCTIRFGGFNLTAFGNSIPQVSAVIRHTITDPRAIVAETLERHGITQDQFDTSLIEGEVLGTVLRGEPSGVGALGPLISALDLLAVEDAGRLMLGPRPKVVDYTIDADMLGAQADDSPADEPFRYGVPLNDEQPGAIVVTYANPAEDFETSSARRPNPANPRGSAQTLSLETVSMSKAEADARAEAENVNARASSQPFSTTLPPSMSWVKNGDVFAHQVGSATKTVLVLARRKRLDGIIEVEGVTVAAQDSDDA